MPSKKKGLHPSDRVVVVGSGITGLCAGALLAAQGHAVTVLERHKQLLGGHARTINAYGVEFSAGPQYLWGFTGDGIGARVLDRLGLRGAVPFGMMNRDGFEELCLDDGRKFAIPMGLDRFAERLQESFPADQKGIREFFERLDLAALAGCVLFKTGRYLEDFRRMQSALLWSREFSIGEKLKLRPLVRTSLSHQFEACRLSDPVRRILFAHGGTFAEVPESIAFGAYASAAGFYHQDACFPEQGMRSLIEGLCGCIAQAGGAVLKHKRVARLGVQDGRVFEVLCSDDSRYECDFVFSTLSPRLTGALLPPDLVPDFDYAPSPSLAACFLGLKDFPAHRALKGKNLWWQSREPIDYFAADLTRPPRMLYAASGSAHGIAGTTTPDAPASLTLFAPASFAQAKAAYAGGPQAYQDFRAAAKQAILEGLDRHLLPGAAQYIRFGEVMTPWDIHHGLGAEEGAVYGRRLTAPSLLKAVPRFSKIENLACGCAAVGLPGVATAFQTAAILVNKIAPSSEVQDLLK